MLAEEANVALQAADHTYISVTDIRRVLIEVAVRETGLDTSQIFCTHTIVYVNPVTSVLHPAVYTG